MADFKLYIILTRSISGNILSQKSTVLIFLLGKYSLDTKKMLLKVLAVFLILFISLIFSDCFCFIMVFNFASLCCITMSVLLR